ncbi:MAG: hypothetical protein ACRCX2_21675 [Paraclostridium sp.]
MENKPDSLTLLERYSVGIYSGKMTDYLELVSHTYNSLWVENIWIPNLLLIDYKSTLSDEFQDVLHKVESGMLKEPLNMVDALLPLLKEKVRSVYETSTIKYNNQKEVFVDVDHRNVIEIFLICKIIISAGPICIQTTLKNMKVGEHKPSKQILEFMKKFFNELYPYTMNEVGKIMVNPPMGCHIDPALYLVLANTYEVSARTMQSFVSENIPDELVTCGRIIHDLMDGENGVGNIIVGVSKKLDELSK